MQARAFKTNLQAKLVCCGQSMATAYSLCIHLRQLVPNTTLTHILIHTHQYQAGLHPMTHIQLAEADLGQHLVPHCAVRVPVEGVGHEHMEREGWRRGERANRWADSDRRTSGRFERRCCTTNHFNVRPSTKQC